MAALAEFVNDAARLAVGLPARLVPYAAQMPLLQAALNRALRVPLDDGALEFLEGRRIRIRVTDAGIDWLIEAAEDRLLAVDRELPEDVSISGELADFALLATRRADHDTLFFQRRIRIQGDTELGLGVKNTIDATDWDDLPPPLRILLQQVGRLLDRLPPPSAAAH